MSETDTIRVCEVSDFGGPEVLRAARRPRPVPAAGEVVVAIAAATVNPTDISARSGAHRKRMPELTPPFVTGWDLAGEVLAVGAGVSGFAAGDPVVGMIPWLRIGGRVGAYAEAAAVDPGWLALRPPELDVVTAATVPLNALTAHQALALIAAPPGSTVVIIGAGGGVGSFATQLAVRAGLRVIATASDADHDWVRGLGAVDVLPRGVDVSALGADAVLDAAAVGARATAAVRDGGVAVFLRGVEIPDDGRGLRIERHLVDSDPPALAELTRLVAAGELRTRVARTLDLDDAGRAHRLLEAGGLRGKIVLTTGRG